MNLGHVSFDCPLNLLPAEWTVFQGRRALDTANQMTAGQEDDADVLVHADLAQTLLLQSSVLLLKFV